MGVVPRPQAGGGRLTVVNTDDPMGWPEAFVLAAAFLAIAWMFKELMNVGPIPKGERRINFRYTEDSDD